MDSAVAPPPPLARPLGVLWAHAGEGEPFDVVIVGSGYGGAAMADGLAGCTKAGAPGQQAQRVALRVALLERGRHWRPGEFPASLAELPGHVRLAEQGSGRVRGDHQGLLDVRLGDDVMALVGNGLGGGSLINAGVLLEPDAADFAAPFAGVIEALKRDGHFDRARRELGGEVLRAGAPVANTIDLHPDLAQHRLAKTVALHRLVAGAQPAHPPLTVAMADGPNAAGVQLTRCTLCGDCMTGCNVGAKDSLDVNLLHRAAQRGVEIYTGATVVSLKHEDERPREGAGAGGEGERPPGHWVLRVAHTDPALQAREKELLFVRARHVVLAAGALGSTEILLRSRGERLQLSGRLGERFSCNGDNIAAVYRMPEAVHGVAREGGDAAQRRVGPTITASATPQPGRRTWRVQEFAVPAALARVFDEAVTTAHTLHVLPGADCSRHGREGHGERDPLAVDPAAIEHTLLVGVVGHDDAAGALRLPQPMRPREGPAQTGVLSIHWPGARDSAALNGPHARLGELVAAMHPAATLIANPLWRMLPRELERLVTQPRGPVLTVHPLGGCGIGATVAEGVVDGHCRVFDAAADGWQGSLLVADGAAMPGSLGVNPALTITALAMRACAALRAARGWQPAVPAPAPPLPRPRVGAPEVPPPALPPAATEVAVIERLDGVAWLDVGADLPRRCVIELTLAYEPKPLAALMSTLERRVDVDAAHRDTRLRVYDETDWRQHHLRVAGDAQRGAYVRFEARLSGHLRFLHREGSRAWWRALRAAAAWLVNRGTRDTWQEWRQARARKAEARRRGEPSSGGGIAPLSTVEQFLALLRLATRAGEVRRFDYVLTIEEVTRNGFTDNDGKALPGLPWQAQRAITGCKRLTYDRRANPWLQLTRLRLERFPGLRDVGAPRLRLDPGFMAGVGVPLMRIARQRDHASALADLASFGLYLARVLISTHLWTFRKPDAPAAGEPQRLPGPVAGIAPQVSELIVDRLHRGDEAVTIRLSRYRPERPAARPPLVMIHGYSVSGNTFTHPTLAPSAAAYFLAHGVDVWVVDLRTSAGLPSATLPWAFEQAALVDIPAALLHIKAVTGQQVDVLAHCIGCAMLGMAILSDARAVQRGELELGVDAWLTSEQLGVLSAFNGATRGARHPCIRRIVLSQKGPVLRYTDANVLRAFVLQSIRRIVLDDDFQFRPPARPTLSDELLDRLLASLPYPDADYDKENPWWPCATTPWTATRHRMDALYGRDFDAANMSDATLAAIDDLFGPINLDTVTQTAHFARFCAITNQAGRAEFVTRARLRDCWRGLPTLALHGEDNGLADLDTQRLLDHHLRGAGVPLQARPYRGMGHQDVLIGLQSARVFADIDDFLRVPDAAFADASVRAGTPPPVASARQVLEPPWAGPRIEFGANAASALRLAVLSRPDQGRARLGLVPVRRCNDPPRFELVAAPHAAALGEPGPSGEWLFAAPPLGALAAQADGVSGWIALLVYDADDTTAIGARLERPAWPDTTKPPLRSVPLVAPARTARAGAAPPPPPGAPLRLPPAQFADDHDQAPPADEAPDALPGGRPPPQATPAPATPPSAAQLELLADAGQLLPHLDTATLQRCFVRQRDLMRAQANRQAVQPGADFSLVVGSCQYPHGLLDRGVAGASLGAMAALAPPPDLALLVGDQIYADATAGLLDATRRDERYDAPHERALRLPGMRALLRSAPVLTLPDDHELVDNWEPLATPAQQARPRAHAERDKARNDGMRAFWRYQRMQRPGRPPFPAADLDLQFGGYPFYLLDTRTQRQPRGAAGALAQPQLLADTQWAALERWLLAHREAVKFVASPALLLPRHRRVAEDAGAAAADDGWGGYPASLHRLLDFIARHQVRRTVFLSGDEHHSLLAQAWLQPAGVKLVSVHASALYAPYPFANGRPRDLAARETIVPPRPFHAQARVDTTFAPPGDGFVRLAVEGDRLHVEFRKADGHHVVHHVALDDAPPA
jgi:cholesterol oxidase